MGDVPSEGGFQSSEATRTSLVHDDGQASSKVNTTSAGHVATPDSRSPNPSAPFYSQYSTLPHVQPRLDVPRQASQQGNFPYGISPSHDQSNPSSFNMGAIAGALPDYSAQTSGQGMHQPNQQAQRGLSGASTSALVYQLQQLNQFSSQAPGSYQPPSPYAGGFAQAQFPTGFSPAQIAQSGGYPAFSQTQQRPSGLNPIQQPYQAYPQQAQQFLYYPNPYGSQSQLPQAFAAQPAQQPGFYGRRSSLPSAQAPPPIIGQSADPTLLSGSYPAGNRAVPGGSFTSDPTSAGGFLGSSGLQNISRHGSETSLSSVPRGPPRKPKQSGHALWVGNLPPGTTVVDLKDHFSREATKDIESLFLISKSNCAFVNYRTEASCTAAMHRFHDSRFHGVRLVCRLRRSSAPASGVPTGPSAMSGARQPSVSPQRSPIVGEEEAAHEEGEKEANSTEEMAPEETAEKPRVAEKFFIVKSLTLQDLELSVRNGIWATQSHNEETLNNAYATADNVYLVFSANKSGEYFGYARMASPISEDATQIINTIPKVDATDATDVPKSIPTPATEWAPKGRIIDDSARGTIFWEADLTDSEDEAPKISDEAAQQAEGDASATSQSWGKPFKVEWISTNRLPFYRTRGLRNPWNANREVKIARDGTELETSVGKRLVQMFHRLGPSSAPMMQLPQQMAGPHIRPF